MTATSVARGETETSVDGAATLLSDCSRTNAEVNLTMRAVIREKLMVPLLFVAALAGISLTVSGYWAVWQSQKSSSDGVMPQALVTLPERRPLAEFILVDDAKGVFDLKSLESRWSFIFFGFTFCPDICPTTLYDLSNVKKEIVALGISDTDLQFVFVSVDPARDKAAQIERYVRYFDPTFLGATGSVGQINNLTRQLGAPFRLEPETAEQVYSVTHSSAVYVVDPLGQYTAIISPPFDAADVAEQFSQLFHSKGPLAITQRP